jgi:hypothetical protein
VEREEAVRAAGRRRRSLGSRVEELVAKMVSGASGELL